VAPGQQPRRGCRSLAPVACAAIAALAVAVSVSGSAPAPWPPQTLGETGLYSDWATKTVAPANLPFSPQYPLWTDGARKSRWLYVPKGRVIDASNPDVWRFPVGTRAWKEFRFGRRAETRLIERTPSGWQFAAYAWNEDETEAPLVPERGIARSVPIRDGVRHGIPSRADCRACHVAGPARLLGLSALQLSPDRDPLAPHAEPPPDGAVDLQVLVARGLLRGLPPRFLKSPPRIAAASPVARAAIGYLHANCGGCHTGAGELASLKFALNYGLSAPPSAAPPALLTGVGQSSIFKVPSPTDAVERICAGRPDASVLVARMTSRHPLVQMPPLGTRIVDDEAVALIKKWIAEDLGTPEATVTQKENRR
jgi:mono/diheme cytochrome c family protein